VESPCISSCPADELCVLFDPIDSTPPTSTSRSISRCLSSLLKPPSPHQYTLPSSRRLHTAMRTPLTARNSRRRWRFSRFSPSCILSTSFAALRVLPPEYIAVELVAASWMARLAISILLVMSCAGISVRTSSRDEKEVGHVEEIGRLGTTT
jgi:hypothetical protein